MKHRFLKDLGIDIEDETEEVLKEFDLNGLLDQISDNRLKEKDDIIEELQRGEKYEIIEKNQENKKEE